MQINVDIVLIFIFRYMLRLAWTGCTVQWLSIAPGFVFVF